MDYINRISTRMSGSRSIRTILIAMILTLCVNTRFSVAFAFAFHRHQGGGGGGGCCRSIIYSATTQKNHHNHYWNFSEEGEYDGRVDGSNMQKKWYSIRGRMRQILFGMGLVSTFTTSVLSTKPAIARDRVAEVEALGGANKQAYHSGSSSTISDLQYQYTDTKDTQSSKSKSKSGQKSISKIPIVTMTTIAAAGASYRHYVLRKRVNNDLNDVEERESQFNEIMGITQPTEESSMAEVYVQNDPKSVLSTNESPLSKLVDHGLDEEEKASVESWFERAVMVSKFDHNKDEDDDNTRKLHEEQSRLEQEALKAEAAVLKAEEEARLAVEEARIAEEEEARLEEEVRLAEEEAHKKTDADESWALEAFAREAEEEVNKFENIIERRRWLARNQFRTVEEEAELAGK